MIERKSKVLISTNRPSPGGVQVMLKFIIDCLQQRDCEITVAYYQPYSISPELSVPLLKTLSRKPGSVSDEFYGQPCVGIGCWLPEFEVTHYRCSSMWQQLIEDHQVHLVVGGSCQPANVFLQAGVPFFAWVASDWQGDRSHRVQQMPALRRLIDRFIVSPIARGMEKRIVSTKSLVALSDPTKEALNDVVDTSCVEHVLPISINTEHFSPLTDQTKNYRIGFVGRFEDPRKNIRLLFDVFARLVQVEPKLELSLIGDRLSESSLAYLKNLGIESKVAVVEHAKRDELPVYLNQLDVFVLPSHQEGLCIAALEAMSCAVPVVSTRCGGPESFIDHKVNGELCGFDVAEMSDVVLQLLSDDKVRMRYASAARKTVVNQFSESTQMARFWALLDQSTSSIKE